MRDFPHDCGMVDTYDIIMQGNKNKKNSVWFGSQFALGAIQVLRNAIFLEIRPPPTPS